LVYLRYNKNRISSFRGIKIISKPTNFIYLSNQMLKLNLHKSNLNSFLILSTNKGILTDKMAIVLNVGGKVLFEIF
jgi:ribosomal protein S8